MTGNKIKIMEITEEIFDVTGQLQELRKVEDHQQQELSNTKRLITTRESDLQDLVRARDELEGRKLERGVWIPLPPDPSGPPVPFNPYPYAPCAMRNKCEVCGIDFSSAMGYCCNNINCPIPRATC